VVQKHDATRLHFDFRLEWDGVLKSWAVTRGPSLDPSEKRLAVRTEDHPLAYGEFEGVIPPKQYGGGTVMLWDRGHWEPENDPEQGLKEGKLSFTLHGERMKGSWALVRMKPRKGEKRENWLLIKHKDEVATARGDITKKHAKSVASDRTMNQIAKGGRTLKASDLEDGPKDTAPSGRARGSGKGTGKASDDTRPARKGKKAAMPRWREPELATLVSEAPEGNDWLSELKYDGYRTLIAIAGGKARIFTRNGKDWTDKFPGIAEAAAALDTDGTLIDGEIVAFDGKGRTDFSTLQKAIKQSGAMSCFVFDLIMEDGREITDLPLVERKERLEKIVGRGEGALVYSDHVRGSAEKVFAEICRSGHEGIVAKRADAPYRSGRGKDWLKVKCTRRQEFVIGGYSPTDKKARPFSSVLIGVQEDGKFVYKGRVGSFSAGTLEELGEALASRARKTSPFAGLPREAARGARFVTPDLVVEVDFAEFTADGVVRHGVVKGIRGDKDAAEVVLEEAGGQAMTSHETRDRIAGVKLSSPDKVLFEEQGVTKADLAAHYERVADRMLPLVEGRLVSLVRCPAGRGRAVLLPAPRPQGLSRRDEAAGDHGEGWRQGDLSPARHAVLADRRRADGHARIPHLGLARRHAGKARPAGVRPRSGRGAGFRRREGGILRHQGQARRPGTEDGAAGDGRQGRARHRAAQPPRGMAGGERLCAGFCAPAGRGRARPLCRPGFQGQAQGAHLRRLAAQRARARRRSRPIRRGRARGRRWRCPFPGMNCLR
jgi:bifunctional non-homologous end joining protein LigD